MRTRPAHRGYHQIAWLEFRRTGSGFDDFSQRLVAKHEEFRALWRRAVLKIANLPVSAANAHLDRPYFYLRRGGDFGRGLGDQADGAFIRYHSNCSHVS